MRSQSSFPPDLTYKRKKGAFIFKFFSLSSFHQVFHTVESKL